MKIIGSCSPIDGAGRGKTATLGKNENARKGSRRMGKNIEEEQ